MLCSVPALRALRAGFPAARITLLGLASAREFQPRFSAYGDDLLEFPGYPGIPEVEFDPARLAEFTTEVQGRFDLALQMHGSGTHSNGFTSLLGAKASSGYCLPALWCPDPEWYLPHPAHSHEIRRWLELLEFLGIPPQGEHLEFPELPEDVRQLNESWSDWQNRPFTCLHPGAFEEERRWPVERFAQAGDSLAAEGYTVVLTGGASEKELTRAVGEAMTRPAVDLAGRTGLGAIASLLRRASLLICNDTGISHLAAAVKTRSVVIFAASDPERWAPLDRGLHRVVGEVMPERINACLHTPEVKGHRCLRDACNSLRLDSNDSWSPASVDEVLEQALELIAGSAPVSGDLP